MTETAAALPPAAPVGPDEGEARPGAWLTLWLVVGLTMFAFVDRQVITLVAAPMARDLSLSDTQIGQVQGLAFAIFTLLATYPAGWLADRFDRRWIVAGMVAIWSAGTVACGLAHNFTQLFIAAVMIAAGEAGLAPIALSVVPDLFTGRKRVLANSVNYLAAYAGVSGALVLTGGLLALIASSRASLPGVLAELSPWRLAFLVAVAPAPVFLALTPFMNLKRPAGDASPRASPVSVMPYLRAHGRTAIVFFVALALYCFAYGGYLVWLPVAAARLFGVTPAQNGLGMGVATGIGTLLGVTAGTLALRYWRPRLGARAAVRLTWISMCVASPFVVGFAFVTSAAQTFALMAVMMIVGTFIGCMVPNMLQDLAPPAVRARIMAIYGITMMLVAGFSPAIVGWLSDMIHGPRSILIAIAVSSLPAWALAALLTRWVERPYEKMVRELSLQG